jgi:patatin-related protein
MKSPSPVPNHKQEVRFAVVMYGGVSLAIYINGIAQELLRLVRSTSAACPVPPTGTERVYQAVSRILACESNGDNQETLNPETAPPTRFVVDIISGTSAGGINGIFLAKSLANGQNMDELKKLWVQEGAIERLINDKKSIEKPLALQDPPTSLLNSERMYYQLLKAFNGMEAPAGRSEDVESPLVDELDLFVTSTDLQGVVLPIRLSDDLIYERRHRNVMHFVYSSTEMSGEQTRNDFHAKYNPFLAFAARCTSAFPFAFEPMCLSDIDILLDHLPDYRANDERRADSNVWQRFYRDYLDPRGVSTVPFPKRAFGDGGYLDNKPFTYATETLANRNADVPVDRKLIYIEPSPEHPEDDIERDQKPDAIQNVVSALLTLPRYETIREDVQRVQDRNRLIERIKTITAGVDRDEYECEAKFSGGTGPLSEVDVLRKDEELAGLDLADMIRRKGRTYAAYHRLRIAAVTDELANLIARVAGFDEGSDYFVIVRSMVRAWRNKKYVDYRRTPEESNKPTAGAFLYEFDLSYPLRRINYLRNRADSLYRFEENAMTLIGIQAKNVFNLDLQQTPFSPKQKQAFRTEVLKYKKELNDYFVSLRQSARSLRSRHTAKDKDDAEKLSKQSPVKEQVKTLMAAIDAAVRPLVTDPNTPSVVLDYFLGKSEARAGEHHHDFKADTAEDECTRRAQAFLEQHDKIFELFEKTADDLKANVLRAKTEMEDSCIKLFTSHTHRLSEDLELDMVIWIAKKCLEHYYWKYEDYDALTYPVLYDTGVGEADTVDIIRISPEDAKELIDERKTGCHKLAGTALGHFGAFLQRGWRENDILWGRLDGAERIITALIPDHPDRAKLIGEAHAEIIVDELSHLGSEERQVLLAESLMRTRSRQAEPDLLDAFTNQLRNNCATNPDLCDKVKNLVTPTDVRQYYVNQFRVRSKVEPESTLRSSARATTVIGKMLEDLSAQRSVNTKYALWIARLGVIFWALVEVAVPQSFPNLIFRHWLKLVYFLEVLLIGASILLVNPTVQQFALTAFGVTVAIHLAVVILTDLIETRNRWLNLAKAAIIVALVLLVITGVIAISALLGSNSLWIRIQHLRTWLRAHETYGRLGFLLTAIFLFLMSIRRDLKAFFKRAV